MVARCRDLPDAPAAACGVDAFAVQVDIHDPDDVDNLARVASARLHQIDR